MTTAVSADLPKQYDFKIEEVQNIVSQSTLNVCKNMMMALIQGKSLELDFKGLATKNINANLDKELLESDAKTQMVYKKLFAASKEFISTKSKAVLGTTLSTIKKETSNPDSPRQFLGSFVFLETKQTVENLKLKEPKSLECKEIWD